MVLSFVVERALAIVFENHWYITYLGKSELKELIAFAVSFLICRHWQFDIVSIVLLSDTTSVLGEVVTAALISGGSKASLKFFHDVIGVRSSADLQRQRKQREAATQPAGH